MTTVTARPTVEHVAQALLVAADPRIERTSEELELLAVALLPTTPVEQGVEALRGISSHLSTAYRYASATPELAQEWFGECGYDQYGALSFAQCLNDRATVWFGEAETLATTTAMRDRERA